MANGTHTGPHDRISYTFVGTVGRLMFDACSQGTRLHVLEPGGDCVGGRRKSDMFEK